MKKIQPGGLTDAIKDVFDTYGMDVTRAATTSCKEVAKQAVRELKARSPRLTGDYARTWTYKQTRLTRLGAEYTVYNRDNYRLTHLLEKGHAKAGGGRVAPRVHIAPVEQEANKKVEQDIKERIRKL